MGFTKVDKKGYKYDLRVKSKVHPEIYHSVKVDLYCYEKINNTNLLCYEKMPNEDELSKLQKTIK